MDDQVIDGIIGLYRWARVGNEDAAAETLARVIMGHLRDFEILQLAAAALTDDATGVDPTPTLATRRLVTLIHKFAIDPPDERAPRDQ